MAGNIKGQVVSGTATDLLDDSGVAGNASLTSLANGSAAVSATQDNTPGTGNAALWATFQLIVFGASAFTAGNTVDLYLLYSLDGGTTFDDGTAGATPVTNNAHFVGSFPLRNVSTKQVISIRGVPLEFLKYQTQLVNNGGVSFAAQNSGSKLQVIYQDEQYT